MPTWLPAELWLLLVWLLLCCALRREDRRMGERGSVCSLWFCMYYLTRLAAKEHLLSEADEVFVVGVDVGELDVYQQQNLRHTETQRASFISKTMSKTGL